MINQYARIVGFSRTVPSILVSLLIYLGQSTLPDTCPVCTHAPLDGSTCNPNKSLRLTIKAFLKSEERKRSKSKISVSTKDTASIGTTSVPPTPADDIKVEIQPELAKEQSVLPSVEQSEEPSAVDVCRAFHENLKYNANIHMQSANAQLDIKADTNTTDSKQEDVVEVIEPSSTIVQEEDSGITEENHQSVPNPVSWQNQGFGPMMNPMMHMGMMNNGFGGFPATMMMGKHSYTPLAEGKIMTNTLHRYAKHVWRIWEHGHDGHERNEWS